MKKVILASSNEGKLKEMQALLTPLEIELVNQSSCNIHSAIESGLTFVENALIKARHACELSGLPAIADDSGLVVPALQGEPGIYSSRYAGIEATDEENRLKLLTALSDENQRQAYFYTAVVYLSHAQSPKPIIAEGLWRGEIAHHEQGENGFGYDAIFYLPQHHCTAAQLNSEQKNKISHRAQALIKLIAQLQS